jgi:hypothetical protein
MTNHPNRTIHSRRGDIVELVAVGLLPRIKCNDAIGHQPAGSCGFRKGEWTVLFDGVPKKIFMSISHAAELDRQYEHARHSAARAIAWEMLKSVGWE